MTLKILCMLIVTIEYIGYAIWSWNFSKWNKKTKIRFIEFLLVMYFIFLFLIWIVF